MSEKAMVLMQGIPGSGKSTMAKILAGQAEKAGLHVEIFSADDFWYSEVGDDLGQYDFDAERAFEAHRWNQRRVVKEMIEGRLDLYIIDNTNLIRERCEPYIQMAQMFEMDWSVLRVDTPVETCIDRQLSRSPDRQVPSEVILRMHSQLETIT
jgi:predicted kinase